MYIKAHKRPNEIYKSTIRTNIYELCPTVLIRPTQSPNSSDTVSYFVRHSLLIRPTQSPNSSDTVSYFVRHSLLIRPTQSPNSYTVS